MENKLFYGQQCQSKEVTEKFRNLHREIVNKVIEFCKENNIDADEFCITADNLSGSIKFGSWQPTTDSCFSLERFSDEYRDIMAFKKKVSKEGFEKIKFSQEPFLYSI